MKNMLGCDDAGFADIQATALSAAIRGTICGQGSFIGTNRADKVIRRLCSLPSHRAQCGGYSTAPITRTGTNLIALKPVVHLFGLPDSTRILG